MEKATLAKYKLAQDIARDTIENLKLFIEEGKTEIDLAQKAEQFMKDKGINSFWYHNLPALVLVGKRTSLSISGKDYRPSSTLVDRTDLVTIDLGPSAEEYWGDFARSFVVEEGRVVNSPSLISSKLVQMMFKGINFEETLHRKLEQIAKPEMAFGELYKIMNKIITKNLYKNLDFKGNLGHSIEKSIDDRIYIENGEKTKLSDVNLFTFEPHIQGINENTFGYKKEDIYYFSEGKLKRL